MAEFQHEHNDAVEGRSGTPNDEQGLTYAHTPVPGACVCVCVFTGSSRRFPGDTCARLPHYDNYCGEITNLFCACVTCICAQVDVCARRHFFDSE